MTSSRSVRAVICEDDREVLAALVDTINGLYGIEVVATLGSGDETVAAAAGSRPDLVVVDLALAGARGLRIVPRLLEVAPTTVVAVVVPWPFADLGQAAVAVGATVLVDLSDLRPLRACLEHLHARVHADVGCPCCAATGSRSDRGGAAQPGARVTIRPGEAFETNRNPPLGGGSSPTGRASAP